MCVRVCIGASRALTVICDLVLQARQLVDPAFGGARDELLSQSVAVQGLRCSIPIHSHVVQSMREGRVRGVGGVSRAMQRSRNDNAKISRLFGCWLGCHDIGAQCLSTMWIAFYQPPPLASPSPPVHRCLTVSLTTNRAALMRPVYSYVLSNLDLARDQAPRYSIRRPA